MIPRPHALAKGYQTTLLAKIFVTSFLAIHVSLIPMIGLLVAEKRAWRRFVLR
jgi:hypothetical protein